MASTPASKLKFRIVHCTGEDPHHPVKELLSHGAQTKGWSSPRFCEYPQVIIVQFEGQVRLRQVQFLSHQSKIATKIELFTFCPPTGHPIPDCTQAAYSRLGYLSLDSNERSGFQARELKSVYVDAQAVFLKVLFHKCYVNKYNMFSQVGLIAFNCLGESLGPDLSMGPPVSNRMSPMDDIAMDMSFDSVTADKLRALNAAKEKAVAMEDYEEAKKLKMAIDRLKSAGATLAKLEERKRIAVANEDYDAAKLIKVEIERIRQSVFAGVASGNMGPSPMHQGGMGKNFDNMPITTRAPTPPTAMRSATPPHLAPMSNTPGGGLGGIHAGGMGGMGGPPVETDPFAAPQRAKAKTRDVFGARPLSKNKMAPGLDYLEQPLPGAAAAAAAAAEGVEPQDAQSAYDAQPITGKAMRRAPSVDPAEHESGITNYRKSDSIVMEFTPENHPLKGVPKVEDLPPPEPLTLAVAKEAEPLISIFGEYVVQCFYSKVWNLREAALQKVKLELEQQGYQEQSTKEVVSGVCTLIRKAAVDKIAQVFLQSMALLGMLVEDCMPAAGVKKTEAQVHVDGFLPAVVDRVGDSNARNRDAACNALLALSRSSLVGPSLVSQHLLRPLKKKQSGVRPLQSRLEILSLMVPEFKLGASGLALEPLMTFAIDGFKNANGDVRNAALKLILAVYPLVGPKKLEPFLSDLRPAQIEMLNAGFESLGSQPAAAELSPTAAAPAKAAPKPPAPAAKKTTKPAPKMEMEEEEIVPPPKKAAAQPKKKAAAPPPPPPAVEQVEEDPDNEFTCQFCGKYDPNFNDENMDMHFWKDCPMLCSCAQCGQVIEITTLNHHLLQECEKQHEHKECPRCKEAVHVQDIDAHVAAAMCKLANPKANRCPLCHNDVGVGEKGWKAHLMGEPGCPHHERTR